MTQSWRTANAYRVVALPTLDRWSQSEDAGFVNRGCLFGAKCNSGKRNTAQGCGKGSLESLGHVSVLLGRGRGKKYGRLQRDGTMGGNKPWETQAGVESGAEKREVRLHRGRRGGCSVRKPEGERGASGSRLQESLALGKEDDSGVAASRGWESWQSKAGSGQIPSF